MKKTLLLSLLFLPFIINAQSLSYTDAAVLFSQDDQFGTARYTGMAGAFGALGADMSAVDINPAGLAVFTTTDFGFTMSYRNTDSYTNFYGTGTGNKDDFFRFSQAGGVIPFSTYGSSDFKRFSIGFNYSLVKDFDNSFFIRGNSGIPDFVDDPYLNYDDDPSNNVYYTNVDDQRFTNYMAGTHDRFSFSFATQYKDFLYFGAAVNTHHIGFSQRAIFEEYNNDGHSNTLDASVVHYLGDYGNGINFSFGAIFKPMHSLRLGLAYQSPTWYDLSENFNEDLEISVSNNSRLYSEYGTPNYFDYSLTTPGQFTGSFAYVFGKMGLVSFDYIYKDYNNMTLKPTGDFIDENQEMATYLQGTSSFRIGTEWRMSIFSFRGGYRFEQSPFRYADSSNDLTGYSLGLGIRFNQLFKFDIAYDNYSYDYKYSFLNLDDVVPANIQENNYRITSTITFSF
jgi:long-subunit fatty acid transport protein